MSDIEKIDHHHLEETPSTQFAIEDYCKAHPQESQASRNILVSATDQTNGHGRRQTKWRHFKNSLAFSFSLAAREQATLATLEIAILLAKFCQKHTNKKMSLKWPNDLYTPENEKLAGIIAKNTSSQILFGVGINWGRIEDTECVVEADYPFSSVTDQEINSQQKKDLPLAIYHYILNNRLTEEEIQKSWRELCCHNHMFVEISEGSQKTQGEFIGIGPMGEAVLQLKDGQKKTFFNGSLRVRGPLSK
jgi:biotin-[acetyl-CoA-carboxylase] ligase BirA-like protein